MKMKTNENTDYLHVLPDEILLKIISYLSISDWHRLSLTCKRLESISKDESLKTGSFNQEDFGLPDDFLMRHWNTKSGVLRLKSVQVTKDVSCKLLDTSPKSVFLTKCHLEYWPYCLEKTMTSLRLIRCTVPSGNFIKSLAHRVGCEAIGRREFRLVLSELTLSAEDSDPVGTVAVAAATHGVTAAVVVAGSVYCAAAVDFSAALAHRVRPEEQVRVQIYVPGSNQRERSSPKDDGTMSGQAVCAFLADGLAWYGGYRDVVCVSIQYKRMKKVHNINTTILKERCGVYYY